MIRIQKIGISLLVVATILIVGIIAGATHTSNVSAAISGTNTLVSYDSTNTYPAGGDYSEPSADGNFVAFESDSSNIVSGDTGGHQDLFLRNMKTSTTTLVDQSSSGVQAASGVYTSPSAFAVSRTGRYVLFTSSDKDLVNGLPTDNPAHVYLRDTVLGTTTLIDQTSSGVVGNDNSLAVSISDDGRFAIFSSRSTNLGGGNADGTARISMKDLSNSSLQALSRSTSGINANNAVSGGYASCDGSLVALGSSATNLTPSHNGYTSTYLVDLRNGFSITNLTFAANGNTYPVSISCNGRYVVLESKATNLTSDSVSGTVNHIYRYDRLSGQYVLIDQSSSGVVALDGGSDLIASPGQFVSDNGAVIFGTYDTDLISPSAVSRFEHYLRTPEANTTELIEVNSSGQEQSPIPNSWRHVGSITADGKGIVFTSTASNLLPGLTLGGDVVFSKVQ